MITQGSRPAPKFAHVGRQARYSFLARDKDGRTVRMWHAMSYEEQITKSLRGMVKP